MLRRPLIAVLVLVLLGGSACRRGGTEGEVGELKDQTIERRLTVEVTGAQSFKFDSLTNMRFLVREATGDEAAKSIASVTLPQPLANPAGGLVIPEVAIGNRYEGAGDYAVVAGTGQGPPDGPKAANPGTPDASLVQVSFVTTEPTPGETRFGYLLEPCKVTFGKDAITGSADCPALLSFKGERVTLKIRWSAP